VNILIVIHAAFEEPGHIETWANKHNYHIQKVSPYKGEKLPDIASYDFLIVMGGPQSPLEIDKSPYLADEIGLIKQAINHKKRILGICLGAQLISESLGAKTERSPHREIGAYPIELFDAAKYDPIFQTLPSKFDVMHWHNDMPGIPQGGVLLAKSDGCPRQAFRYGDRVYGFQCHLELTPELVKGMIEHCPHDLKPGAFIMTKEQLMAVDYSQINSKLEAILDYLVNLPE
jgi:GMP synthase (glutamine-hydrolysing)